MYTQSSDDNDKKNVAVDQFKVIVQSSQDSLPQTLTGTSTPWPANLILIYSFSENECSGETPSNSLSSTSKW